MDFTTLQPMIQENVIIICSMLITLLVAFITMLVKKGMAWIDAKTNNIKNENVKVLFKNSLDTLEVLVVNIVNSFEQEIVKDLKSLENVDSEALKALRVQAADRILDNINEETKKALEIQIADIREFVLDMVSAQVLKLRQAETSV